MAGSVADGGAPAPPARLCSAPMSLPGGRRAVHALATLLVLGAVVLADASGAGAAEPVQLALGRIAYVTSSVKNPEVRVWIARPNGAEPRPLGPGDDPLLAPNGATVAASLFGSGGGEKGPALALYPTSAARPA